MSSSVDAFFEKQKQRQAKEDGDFEKQKSHKKEEEEVEQEQELHQKTERRKLFSSSSSASASSLSVLPTTRTTPTMTTLLFPPCLLFLFTLLSVWFFPSSYYHDFMHRIGGTDSLQEKYDGSNKNPAKSANPSSTTTTTTTSSSMIPKDLVELGIYNETSDFMNERGISPTGWENPTYDDATWGPCRFLKKETTIQWNDRRRHRYVDNTTITDVATDNKSDDYYHNADVNDFDYHRRPNNNYNKKYIPTLYNSNNKNSIGRDGDGWCRPGFLIIGAGKCGTSSLYHYLVKHPRVVPAIEKQIHYFKYTAKSRPLEWYYGHFPTPKSFLEHGALITGEASPGYLPYPDVARDVKRVWTSHKTTTPSLSNNHNSNNNNNMVPPKIITVGREPFDRLYSSYRYNYVVPTIQHLRKKGHPRIPSSPSKSKSNKKNNLDEEYVELNHPDDEYYKPYLFTLEDFIRAELKQLKACLYDWGPERTYLKWKDDSAYKKAFIERRQNNNNNNNNNNNDTDATTTPTPAPPPLLIDLDGICYGKSINKIVYREQWSQMQMEQPNKVLLNTNLHLTQALIGRSLYVLPLEWWYINFKQDGDITFVCTEELTNPETMNDIAGRLGLPKYDGFDAVVGEGAYNVGGHRGYDTATSWDEIQEEEGEEEGSSPSSTQGTMITNNNNDNVIPLPDDLYQELKDFIDPLNERLFALTGKRCNW